MSSKIVAVGAFLGVGIVTYFLLQQENISPSDIGMMFFAIAGLFSMTLLSKNKRPTYDNPLSKMNSAIFMKIQKQKNQINTQQSEMIIRARDKRGK